MTLMPPTRKRNRSCGEEDFLPLSKKINNLHINNWSHLDGTGPDQIVSWNHRTEEWVASQQHLLLAGRSHEDDASRDAMPAGSASTSAFDPSHHGLVVGETDSNAYFDRDCSHESCGSSHMNCASPFNGDGQYPATSMVYNPDLNMDENPYYYENNKLLFELYVERLRRSGY